MKKVSLILTISGVGLWAWSITQASLRFGFYGSISSYPVTYFVALGLVALSSFILWGRDRSDGRLLCLQLILFITMLKVTPLILGSNPLFAEHVYRDFANGEYIAQFGHLNPADPALWYHNWPGAYLLQAVFIKLCGASNPDVFAYGGEYLISLLILAPLFAIMKHTISQVNLRWAACWIFATGYCFFALYYNPQGIAFFILLTLIAFLSSTPMWSKTRDSIGTSIGVLILLIGLSITHLLTSIYAFFALVTFEIINKRREFTLALFAGATIALWTSYGAINQIALSLPGFMQRAFDIERWFAILQSSAASPEAQASIVATSLIKMGFVGFFGLLGITGLLLSLRSKNGINRLMAALLIAAGLTLLPTFYDKTGGVERAYLFGMIAACYFSVELLKHTPSRIIVCLLMMCCIPVRIIAYDGYLGITQYLPKGEVSYYHFLHDYTTPAVVTGGTPFLFPGYENMTLQNIVWQGDSMEVPGDNAMLPQMVHIGATDEVNYRLGADYYDPELVASTQSMLQDSADFSLIYANPALELYFHED